MTRDTRAEQLPESIEELLGYILRHVASELGAGECPAPLAESLRVYTRAVIAATRAEHEHPTPVVHVDHSPDVGNMVSGQAILDHSRPTLPTEPPVDYSDPPRRKVVQSLVPTNKGFPRPADD